MEAVRSLESDPEQSNRLAECSLFVCNKWDLVPPNQQDKVKKHTNERLMKCWTDRNLESQIVYLSTSNATKVQQYGGVTKEFSDLVQSINTMILKAIKARLYNHCQ